MDKKSRQIVFTILAGVLAGYILPGGIVQSSRVSAGESNVFPGGTGTEEDPFLVETAQELDSVRNHLGSHFKQIADIDLSDYGTEEGWTPIGSPSSSPVPPWTGEPFKGNFDGNGYKIINLTINQSAAWCIGLFGYLDEDAKITNVVLEGIDITGVGCMGMAGGLAGWNNGAIMNSNAIGDVSGMAVAGVLVGHNSGDIVGSFTEGNVSGEYAVGGLTGINRGNIKTSYAIVEVSGSSALGGFVGKNSRSGYIEISGAAGNVSGDFVVGGFAGRNIGVVTESCAMGEVAGTDSVDMLIGSGEMRFSGGILVEGKVEGSYTQYCPVEMQIIREAMR